MAAVISIVPFSPEYKDQVASLILSIQREEFNIPISLQDQPDLNAIPDYYQNGAGNFWIALVNGSVVGTVALLDIGNAQVALRKMFVAKQFRGSLYSTARQLLSNAVSWAQIKGLNSIFLGTTAQFLAAHRFYEKHGFMEISRNLLPPAFPLMAVDSKFYQLVLAEV
jgi:N-acetylglutamate synthase-like GNAT family acetyltransferase